MAMCSYWKYKCDQLQTRLHDLVAMRKCKAIPRQLTVAFQCKRNDLSELITEILTENEDLISLIKPIVKELNTKISLHNVYKALYENLNITIQLDKSFADITLKMISKCTSALISNTLNCMKVKECLGFCLDEQNPTINYISWNCERYVNHVQVLVSLLSTAEMKPLVPCKSEPCMLTVGPLCEIFKEIQNRPYYHPGNQDYNEHKQQSRHYMLRESSSETPRTSYTDLDNLINENYTL